MRASTEMRRHRRRPADRTVLTAVLLLVLAGTVMVYSASSSVAVARYGDGAWYLKRHLLRVVLGLSLMGLLASTRYARVARLGRGLLFVAFAALVLVLLPGLGGVEAKGAHRWLAIGGIGFQPSDLARFALLLWLADALSARRDVLDRFSEGLLPVLAPVAVACALIFLEPDYSTALVLGLICLGMIYAAGTRLSHLGALALGSLPVIYAALMSSAYRRSRVLAFLDGNTDVQGVSYQVLQSLIGLGSGGILGQGLGNSAQKLRFLPEPYNDFIFSIIGEELGFVGALAILVLFLVLVIQGLRIAQSCRNPVGRLLAVGVSLTIGLHVLINVAVVTSSLPATGLALPFISYGGSSLLFSMAGVGLLLSISRDADVEISGRERSP